MRLGGAHSGCGMSYRYCHTLNACVAYSSRDREKGREGDREMEKVGGRREKERES